jgi:hypothetical protein
MLNSSALYICLLDVLVLCVCAQVILVNRLMDQQLCLAEEQAVTNVADAAGFGEVQKVQASALVDPAGCGAARYT